MNIELECTSCGKTFLRGKSEYNRNKKIGRKIYCSRSCAGKGKWSDGFKPNTCGLNRGGDYKSDKYTPFKWYIKVLKNEDRQKKGVNIDLEYLKYLWEEQDGKCPFTGHTMELRTYNNCHESLRPDHASLDRIDNDRGYEKGNVRFISAIANFARRTWTDEEVISFCLAVAEKHIPTRKT